MATTGKLIIFSAPSGSGKTTIVKRLLKIFPQFEFSISATSRQPRGQEQNGVDYFFLSQEEFREKVAADAFTCYGTLKSEMERIWAKGNIIIFDVDVMGGINLKRIFGEQACSVFIMPPSVEVLRERLIGRGTDSMETIEKRVAKAEFEISKSGEFDYVVVNDILDTAVAETEGIINNFLAK